MELEQIKQAALKAFSEAKSVDELYEAHVQVLGRKGAMTVVMQSIATIEKSQKAAFGQACNVVKKELEAVYEARKKDLEEADLKRALNDRWVDPTAPGKKFDVGHLHPLSQVQNDVERIFSSMGFAIMDGPEVESEYYNFEALNVPSWHPARDMQDTFFIKGDDGEASEEFGSENFNRSATISNEGRLVLRTQTSPVQIRSMKKYGAPLRIIAPGRVFRNEATDARHEHTFDQVEGLLIDENISLADLKGVMQEFLTQLFGRVMKVRFRPGYFPFVEPGIELDMSCTLCNEKGCRVCKGTGWLEFMGAGMVHPNVLAAGGIDSNKYQGWAFGFGLTRLVMMRYNIDDIRLLSSGDLRFIKQF